MILMIDNYDSFTYNLVHYARELGADVKVIRNDDMPADEALALGASGIILSPGPKTPDDAGMCLELLKTAPDDLPIFGVCLGQQSIGQVF
ncbi:MAG: aminodeoxychorismate/anthranilate synthase component II, partial [Robiginitomaculum sp.]